jgi:AraC family transcriptional regulator, transcriptional activator of pobA
MEGNMDNSTPISVKTITELHRHMEFPKPEHPLISIIDYGKMKEVPEVSVVFDFYSISVKRGADKMFYGQQSYDFDEGVMACLAPHQVLRAPAQPADAVRSGWILFIHPDFLWNTPLARKIKQYEYFHYSANEALFLSDKEEVLINGIAENIRQEYHSNMDKFSREVIVAQLELLFTYAQRFYERQFITRTISNSKMLTRLEEVLADYFNNDLSVSKGLPTVQYVSGKLNLSTKYLSSLLKQLTGQTTQQHIHEQLIAKAKEKLSGTDLSVSEIAYGLGFEHSQSFSKLFKTKTNLSPLAFRASFQ